MSLIHSYTTEDETGRKYQVDRYEDDNTQPWERECEHGPVTGWTVSQQFAGDAGFKFECITYFTK